MLPLRTTQHLTPPATRALMGRRSAAEGPLGGGRDSETALMRFAGDLPQESFAEFAAHRAARLSLAHTVVTQDAAHALIRVTGPAALVDAFEMALSLGPRDCLVRDVTRLEPEPEPAP